MNPCNCQVIECALPDDYEYNEQSALPEVEIAPEAGLLPWDCTGCQQLDIPTAAHDTFDCYPVGAIPPITPSGYQTVTLGCGYGLGEWIVADSPFGTAYGDDFEQYAEQNPIVQTLVPPSGFGVWIVADGP